MAFGARGKTALSPCRGGADRFGTTWGQPQQRAVQQAFEATDAPYAADVWRTVERTLDSYSRRWVAEYTEACEATRVRGEQSDALLDRRMLCLEQRKKEAAAIIGLYTHADEKDVERATESVNTLSGSLFLCGASALSGAPLVPSDPVARGKLDEVQRQLANVEALDVQGRYKDALDIAKPTVQSAEAAGYRPLLAEARFWLADVELALGDLDSGVNDGRAAGLLAEAVRMDAVAARAWGNLMSKCTGHPKCGDPHLFEGLAGSAVERLGGDARLEATLLGYSSSLASVEEHDEEALAVSNRAVALIESVAGSDSLAAAQALAQRGKIEDALGHPDEASGDLERALTTEAQIAGAEHPVTGVTLEELGRSRYLLGRYDEAIELYQRALAIMNRSLGPDHPETGHILLWIGVALAEEGRPAEARTFEERALPILERRYSSSDFHVAMVHYSLSEADLMLEDLSAAEKEAQTSFALFRSEKGEPLSYASAPLSVLARIERARKHPARALRLIDQALAILERDHGDDQSLGEFLITKGELLRDIGARDAARQTAKRAVDLLEAQPSDPQRLAHAHSLLESVKSSMRSSAKAEPTSR
jgi:tetratricopeptide (TPR) repeat protein